MSRLWPKSDKVPEHVRIFQARLRVPLLCMDERWKEDGVAQKEDGRVVAHQIPISLRCVKLDGKPSWITHRVGGTRFPADRRESYRDRCPGARLKHASLANLVGKIRGRLKVAEPCGSLGVYHALWDTFAIKFGQVIQQDKVLQQNRTTEKKGQREDS